MSSRRNVIRAASVYQRRVAVERCAALLDVAALCVCGAGLAEARAQVAARRGVAVASLKRWGRLVRDVPRVQWAACLLPAPRGRATP
jgi:hypothetical protein